MLTSRFHSFGNVVSRLNLNLAAALGAALLFVAGGLTAGAQTTTAFTSSGNSGSPAISISGSCSASTSTLPITSCSSSSGTYGKGGYGSSSIAVPAGDAGTLTNVTVSFNGLTSSGAQNNSTGVISDSLFFASFILVSPGGQRFELMGCTGDSVDGDDSSDSGSGVDDVTVNIADANSGLAPEGSPWQHTGTFNIKPTSFFLQADACGSSTAPTNVQGVSLPKLDGSATFGTTFSGGQSNGTWTLYVVNDDTFFEQSNNDPLSVNNWTLNLTYNATASASTSTEIASGTNPSNSGSSVIFTATVTSTSTVNGGTVAFTSNGAAISGCSSVPVSNGVAQCNPSFTQGLYSIGASYSGTTGFLSSSTTSNVSQLVEGLTTSGGTDTFCNTGSLPIAEEATSIIYPSIIKVTGFPGQTVSNVEVKLLDVQGVVTGSHLLVSPDGNHNLDFFDDAFNESDSTTGAWFDFYDAAGGYPNTNGNTGPPANSSGSPANYEASNNDNLKTAFPSSDAHSVDNAVPQVPGTINYAYNAQNPGNTFGPVTETFESNFNGATADGDWVLYPYENYADSETIAGGWCIALTVNTGVATTTTVSSNHPDQTTGQSVTLTATVTASGNPVTSGGTVTFLENGVAPPGTVSGNNVVTLNGSGQATFTTSTFPEGDNEIVAEYSGTASDDASQTTFVQRMDNATTLYSQNQTISHGPTCTASYCYCNGGSVANNPDFKGAFTPNPSAIFVTDLPGTIQGVTLGLNQFSTATGALYAMESMVVSPAGADLDFFSNTGGTSSTNLGGTASLGNYTFSDAASSLVPDANATLSPNTYKPSSYLEEDPNWPEPAQPYTASLSSFYPLPSSITYASSRGSGTFSSQFSNTNPNGAWALYLNLDDAAGAAGAANGWCVNFTENPVTVTAEENHQGTGTGTDFVQGETQAQITTVVTTNNSTGPTGDAVGNNSNPLKLSDTLNSALTYQGFTGTGWACSNSSQTVTCTNDASIAQGASYPTLTLLVNVSSSAPGTMNNSVSLSGAGITATNSNTDTITVDATPVLSVGKSHSGNFTTGTTGVWTIMVSNNAANGSTNGIVTVSDTLPTGYALNTYSSSGNLWSCSGSGTVTCTATPGIAGGSSSTITLTVNVPSNSPTVVSNTALAWGGGDLAHVNQGTAAASNTDNVNVDAAPAVTSPASTTFTTGSEGIFTVTTTGNPNPALSETGSLPSGVTFVDNGNGSASLSGIPMPLTGGVYSFTITAANGVTPNATQNFTLTVDQSPVFTSNAGTTFGTGAAGAFTITTSAFPAPALSESGSLPGGVSFTDNGNGTASLTGTPAFGSAGNYPLNFTATNGIGTTGMQSFTLTVNPPPAFVVTTNSDDASGTPSNCPVPSSGNACTLRDAVAAAASAGSGNITFDPTAFATPQTITLSNGSIGIPQNTTITGATTGSGASLTNLVTVDGGGGASGFFSVFSVGSGINNTAIANLNIADAVNPSSPGGDINNSGTLAISGSSITSGISTQGGGILNSGTLTISSSVIASNSGEGGQGGGIYNSGSLTVTGSTISGNSAASGGGGIYSSGSVMITESTLSGNSGGVGGGISLSGAATCTLNNSTVSANSTNGAGGGVAMSGTTLNLANSIVEGNTASGAYPDVESSGGNLIDNGGNVYNTNFATSTVSPGLAALANYGGALQTMIPEPGSAAICAGLVAEIASGVTTDERGDPNTNTTYPGFSATACVDSGAVQTNYTISFTTQPPANAALNNAMIPAPVVTLNESGAPIAISAGTVTIADTASLLTGTLSEAVASGAATFNNLIIPTATTGDTLNATLALTSSINLTAQASTEITAGVLSQTITFPNPGQQTVGTPLTLAATASSGLPITYSSISQSKCTVSGATATFISYGTCTIYAEQAGNSGYTAAAEVPQSFAVNQQTQTITFANPGPQAIGTPITLSATASSGLPITYSSITEAKCTLSGATVTFVAPGTCNIYAEQRGNGAYAAAAEVPQSFAVNQGTQTINFANPGAQAIGTPLTLSATVNSGLPITYSSISQSKCTIAGDTVTFIATGTCTIYAEQKGNSNYLPAAEVSQSFAVTKGSQTITFANPGAQTIGAPLTLSATASSGLAITYSTTTGSQCTVSGNTVTFIATGTCSIYAQQNGNSSYFAATEVSQSFTVNGEPQTITFANPGPQTVGTPLTLSATSSSGLAVTFSSTTGSRCTVSGNTATFIKAGTCIIVANQSGNSTYAAAPQVPQSFAVN